MTYEQSTLTAQWKYDLGKHGSSAGYLRRGVYGTAVAAHSAGAPFARLKQGSYFTIGYDAADVGATIYVKLLSFNPHGGGKQTLDQVSSHAHTLAAPPAVSTGLLPGLIQTPDIAINAATVQLTVSAAGPITLPTTPTSATLVSGYLTTIGELVQIAYNAQFTNASAAVAESRSGASGLSGRQRARQRVDHHPARRDRDHRQADDLYAALAVGAVQHERLHGHDRKPGGHRDLHRHERDGAPAVRHFAVYDAATGVIRCHGSCVTADLARQAGEGEAVIETDGAGAGSQIQNRHHQVAARRRG